MAAKRSTTPTRKHRAPTRRATATTGSRGRRRASQGLRWDRVGRVTLLVVLVGMAYLYLGPTRAWISTYGEAREKSAQVTELRERQKRLQERAQALRNPATLEAEARRLGMVRKGERAYVIEGLPKR